MKSFKHYILESFEKPYKWKLAGDTNPRLGIQNHMKGNFKGKEYNFETSDGRKGEVQIFEYDINPPDKYQKNPIPGKQGRIMEMHFAVESTIDLGGGEFDTAMDATVTGEGDAMKIFATVLDVVQKYVNKNKPDIIKVIGMKQGNIDADHGGVGSRIKLYDKLVKRYVGKLGYTYDGTKWDVEDRRLKVMRLVRKGYVAYPKGHLLNP
jgi:hypothetical protein